MLDMGFIPDVEKIVSLLPAMRQTLFFSATMPDEIRRLSKKFLSNPKEVSVDPPASAAETVTQLIVHTQIRDKRRVLRKILKSEGVLSALIFCNRKRDVGILHRSLQRHGFNAGALHGDMDQYSRMQTLDEFKRGKISLLVCSDVAARGLDIPAMGHVFNFDVPTHAEDYIHRIGRTGRAGRSGRAITLATPEDQRYLDNLTKLLGKPIPKFEENASAEPKKSTETSVTAAPAPAETSVTAAPAPTETSVTAAPAPAETRERSTSNERSPRVRGRRNGRARPATAKTAAKPTERTPLSAMPEENKPFGQGDQVPAFLLREPPK
jgi:superfamily II DNA/RNA helicase